MKHDEEVEIERQRRPLKVAMFITIGLLMLGVITVGLLAFWTLAPDDVLTVKNNPVPVRTIRDHPKAGGVAILDVNYCKNIKATGTVRPSFISTDREIFLPTYQEKQDPVCREVEVPVLIPRDIPPGMYHVHFRVTYNVNPLKSAIIETLDSKPFEVFK